ncbi:OmpA family protein [Sedimenticola sp.]|uniref:OmpA family protein n=1 Tax=Sedimenticola sp. TaxID=1940285 RepID=UPI003D126C71
MAQFKHKKLIAMLAPLGLIGGMVLSADGLADNHNRYAIDASKGVVKNGAGECWLTVGGMQEKMIACGDRVAMDSDGDGVTDDKDKCPGTPRGAPVDASGCPLDSDGDGVPDYLDKCPGTKAGAKVDKDGCEIMMKPMAKMEKVVIDNILLFDFDSAELKSGSADVLNNSYAKFKNNDAVKSVIVTGHTDSMGSEAYNQGLSERRANAVRDYLISQGADASKLQARGAGESQPAFTNDTKAGRAMNRRVEFDVMMK